MVGCLGMEQPTQGPNEDALQFLKLLKDVKEPCYEGGISDKVGWLTKYLDNEVKSFKRFVINGIKFCIKDFEANRKTQNNGVSVITEGRANYYDVLTDIIELNYSDKLCYVFFKCKWVDVISGRRYKTNEFGFLLVNFTRLIYEGDRMIDEPCVLASQALNVFYVEDPRHEDWMAIIKTKASAVFDVGLGASSNNDDVDNFCENVTYNITVDDAHDDVNENLSWTREM
nr:hypothetical protein CFP56_36640 [Quercus suber]